MLRSLAGFVTPQLTFRDSRMYLLNHKMMWKGLQIHSGLSASGYAEYNHSEHYAAEPLLRPKEPITINSLPFPNRARLTGSDTLLDRRLGTFFMWSSTRQNQSVIKSCMVMVWCPHWISVLVNHLPIWLKPVTTLKLTSTKDYEHSDENPSPRPWPVVAFTMQGFGHAFAPIHGDLLSILEYGYCHVGAWHCHMGACAVYPN